MSEPINGGELPGIVVMADKEPAEEKQNYSFTDGDPDGLTMVVYHKKRTNISSLPS